MGFSIISLIVLAAALFVCKAVDIKDTIDATSLKKIRNGFHIGSGSALLMTDSQKATISDGELNVPEIKRYQQKYRNIPIIGCGCLIEKDDSGKSNVTVANVAVNLHKDIKNTEPRITAVKALDLARSLEIAAHKAGNRTAQQLPKESCNEDKDAPTPNRVDSDPPKPESKLVIILEGTGKLIKARLVYHVTYFIDDPTVLSNPNYLIDANSGAVVEYWEGLNGYFMESYGGNTKIGQYRYGEGRWKARMLDVEERHDICTLQNSRAKLVHCYHGISCFKSSSAYRVHCRSGTSDGDSGAYSQAADAFWFTTATMDMLRDWFNDLVIPNRYKQLCVLVHYRYRYSNAGWSRFRQCILFGDGDNDPRGRSLPFTTADIVAHEVGHAYTDATSNLFYSRESGGMNEAFSDMMGETFKAYLRGETDWLHAHDKMRHDLAGRYMKYPPLDGRSIQCQRHFHRYLDVHFSSGIYNKAFYLLATSPGWNIKRAFQVFVDASRFRWHSRSTFNSGACGVEWAARRRGYGDKAVKKAFETVGVFCYCPYGFVRLSSVPYACYKFHRDIASWAEAKTYCESIGARLVTFSNGNEFIQVRRYLQYLLAYWTHKKHQNGDFWVGASDLQSEYSYRWTYTQESVRTPSWIPGQPSDRGQGYENCLSLKRYVTSTLYSGTAARFNYGLSDDSCYLKKFYICQKGC